MKKIYLYVFFVCLCLFSVFFSVYDVRAAEETYQYYLEKNSTSNKYWYGISFNLNNPETQKPVAWLSRDSNGKVSWVRYCVYDTSITSNTKKSFPSKHVTTNSSGEETVTNNYQLNVRAYNVIDTHENTSCVFNSDGNVNTNIPLFNSHAEAVNYMLTGSTDGWLNKPEYDLSLEHDFSSDIWTPDIPVPELSQISHTGFTLDNWTEDYYVDIIVNNHLSRIMMGKRYPSNDVIPLIIDSNPWYSEHYWNFTLHDVIPSRSVIDINELFGVDIQGALIEDFKNWSIEHPTINTVDRYNWTHIGQADEYLAKHVYKSDGSLSDVEQLKNSGQAITEYYVRYFTLDGKYGQWGHYKLRDFSYNGQGELVDSGRVTAGTIDNSGKPSNTVTGSTDTNGIIDYTPIVDTNVDVNVGQLRDVLDSFANGVGQVPSLIAQVFSFLPWWINTMIAGIIAICIMLRVLGR